MAEISTSAVVILFAVVAAFGLLYEKGKKKYQGYLAPLDKKEFPMRDFLPVGFALMDVIRYQYNTAFDRKNRKFLKELYDPEYVEFYLRVYWALACAYAMIAL